MNRTLLLLPAAWMVAVAPGAAQAPVSDPWLPLVGAAEEGVDLRYQLEPVEGGWQLQLKNAGSRAIHFGFHLRGVQSPEDAVRNGRVHLERGELATPFIAWRGEGPAVLPVVVLTAVRPGADEGPFWREF